MNQLQLPGKTKNLAGAQLNPSAVIEAIEFLELERPVEIKWSAGLRRRGCHRLRDGRHVITVSTYLDFSQLSSTTWHELTHAAQAERFDSDKEYDAAYAKDCRLRGYGGSLFEIEAREYAEDFAVEMPLAN